MKRFLSLALAASLVALITIIVTDTASAQSTQGQGKGSLGVKWGSYDNDGDGILNCNDPDYVKPQDGTGKKLGGQSMSGKVGYGPGNGSGNNGIGPRDGSGFGKGSGTGTGIGVCDGTGPKGNGRSK
jgi:hypothetical protein